MDSVHIKEMASRLQITPRAIRFYEEKGLIAPTKETTSGYRRFSEQDLWRLQTVITLREVGMPIEEIKHLLNELDRERGSLLTYLELQRSYMYDRWVELKNVIQTTEAMIQQVKQDSALEPAALFQLAEANKRLRQTRKEWVDRWNFNQLATIYDDLVFGDLQEFHPHNGYDQVLQQVVSYINPRQGEKGLDAGTGTGNLVKLFAELPVTMCAFDQSIEMLKKCKAKNPQVETKLGNFLAIPFLDHSFDFVVSSYALHHSTDEQKRLILQEFDRVLKQGGRLAIADFMFADQEKREEHFRLLQVSGQEQAIKLIENEYYADRSLLLDQLKRLGFTSVESVQINTYVHLIGAWKS